MTDQKKTIQTIAEILPKFEFDQDKYISQEFQKYGYDLALELGDMKHKALYIKLAKQYPRVILEKARCFVKDANARSKGRLFMWKLNQLKNESKPKSDTQEESK